MNETQIDLTTVAFTGRETPLATHAGINVSAFRYPSGVAALRLRNRVGEVVVLPFHGQQIWDAQYYGRRLTMASIFAEPQPLDGYLLNYGAFLLHCGATGMGNPGPDDTHPLHGDLPNALYQQASLVLGTQDGEGFVGLTGTREHRVAFEAHYTFTPMLRLFEATGRMTLDVTIRNLRSKPMDLMYMAHINFRPVDGATIHDAVPDTPAAMRVRRRVPPHVQPDAAYRELIETVAASPGLHRRIEPGRRIDPELVLALDCRAGADGWTHSLQQLPDGSADFVSHRPAELNHGVRWIARNGDEDALGLLLPATAEADGRNAERAKGNVRQLAPGAQFVASIAFGALTPAETAAMAGAIDRDRAAR